MNTFSNGSQASLLSLLIVCVHSYLHQILLMKLKKKKCQKRNEFKSHREEKKKHLFQSCSFRKPPFAIKQQQQQRKRVSSFFFLDVNAPKKKRVLFSTDSNMRRESCFQKGKVRLFRSNKAEHLLKRSLCDEVRK